MKKDAYYFPHYSNARNDAKLLKLRRVLGVEGYGIYFMLLEILREQTDFKLPIKIVEELEYDLRVSKEKILSVITNFELFDVDSQYFFSPKLVLYLQPYIEKSERARIAANLRWAKINRLDANADANALHLECESECKESKVKESKVKEINKENKIIPSENEFLEYCKIILQTKYSDYEFSLKSKYQTWVYDGWKTGHNKPIKNWKNTINNTIPFLKPTNNGQTIGTKSGQKHPLEDLSRLSHQILQGYTGENG